MWTIQCKIPGRWPNRRARQWTERLNRTGLLQRGSLDGRPLRAEWADLVDACLSGLQAKKRRAVSTRLSATGVPGGGHPGGQGCGRVQGLRGQSGSVGGWPAVSAAGRGCAISESRLFWRVLAASVPRPVWPIVVRMPKSLNGQLRPRLGNALECLGQKTKLVGELHRSVAAKKFALLRRFQVKTGECQSAQVSCVLPRFPTRQGLPKGPENDSATDSWDGVVAIPGKAGRVLRVWGDADRRASEVAEG